jgi:nicotinamide-nucleotide amidase
LSARPIPDLARAVLDAARARGSRLATAESCTGGLIAAALTAHAGSSDVVERGWVTYSNAAKAEELGVRADSLAAHGAVSERVARELAEGALARAAVDVAVAVTGIAGPGGATPTKPVGLVHLAVARAGAATLHERHVFAGDRTAVRAAATEAALRLVLAALEKAAVG